MSIEMSEKNVKQTIVLLPKTIWTNRTRPIVEWLKGTGNSPHGVHDSGADCFYILVDQAKYPEFQATFPRFEGGATQYYTTKLIH